MMSDSAEFKYEIGISFLAQDEAIATNLADQFEGRLSVFLYSKKQEVVAGTDGELTFGKVFGKESRLVVVLFREGWGQTRWTRIEETAIRDRGHDQGYDFCILVMLDEVSVPPAWFPRQRIYVGWAKYGLKGAASVIEARVQDFGGTVRVESIEDRAARIERKRKYQDQRTAFLKSYAGVQAAMQSTDAVLSYLMEQLPAISTTATTLSMKFERDASGVYVYSSGPPLRVQLHSRWANDLTEAELEATLWNMAPPRAGYYSFERAETIGSVKFTPDMSVDGSLCWKSARGAEKDREFSAAETADAILRWWLDQVWKRLK